MNHSRYADQFSTVRVVYIGHQPVFLFRIRLIPITLWISRHNRHKRTSNQIVNDKVYRFSGDVEPLRQILNRPGLRPAVPDEQERFEVWDAFNLTDDELIDFVVWQALWRHSGSKYTYIRLHTKGGNPALRRSNHGAGRTVSNESGFERAEYQGNPVENGRDDWI